MVKVEYETRSQVNGITAKEVQPLRLKIILKSRNPSRIARLKDILPVS